VKTLALKPFATPENNFNFKMIAIPLYFLSMGIAWSFALFMIWWFCETKAFCSLRKKAKIGKPQRLKMGLGMSNIELK